jgi:1,4-dihydroxy-2-naphthoate octaprenyltransferase
MAPLVRSLMGVSRAPFLLLPVTLVAAGAAASAYEGGFSWTGAVVALVGLVAAHVGVNSLNEASDMQTGIDLATERTPFSGGSGTLPSGAMSVRATYAWGLGATAVAAAVGVWFTLRIGWIVLPVVLAGAFCVLAYTHLLARIGLGEVFAGLGLGGLPVIGTSLVLDGAVGPAACAAAFPSFLMTFNLLLLNEFPDEEADCAGGRRNLVLLLGRPRAAVVYLLAAAGVPVGLGASVALGALPPFALAAILPSAFLAPAARWAIRSPMERPPIPALGGNVAWNLLTNLLVAVGLVVAML